jgi:L-fuculose-phosphate aldolase
MTEPFAAFADLLAPFQRAGADLVAAGLVGPYGGSLSIWTPDGPIVTRRDAPLGRLTADDLCLVGRSTAAGAALPALDTPIHRAVYVMSDGRALIGLQPPHALALAAHSDDIDLGEALGEMGLRHVPVQRHARDIVRVTAEALAAGPAVLVRGHSAFVRGMDLDEAVRLAALLERAARIRYLARLLGPLPEPEPPHDEPPADT